MFSRSAPILSFVAKSAFGIDPYPYTICTSTMAANLTFAVLFAVPIFASNEIVAKYEANNIYFIQTTQSSIGITRYYEISKNCIERRRYLVFIEGLRISDDPQYQPDKGKGCDFRKYQIPWLPLTSIYISDDQSLILLVSCNKEDVNVTVLVGCFMIYSHLNWERELEGFLRVKNISFFRLFKVNFESRLKSFLDNPPRSNNPHVDLFKRCPKKKMYADVFSLHVILSLVVMLLMLIIIAYFVKRKHELRVHPLNY